MALFLLDCDIATSSAGDIDSTASEFESLQSEVSGYDTSCEDGFDFSSAKSAIASNLEACSIKAKNSSKLINAVVSAHTSLQNKLIYGKKEEESQQKSNSSSRSGSGGSGGSSGGGGGYSGGGGGGYSGASGIMSGVSSAIASELSSAELGQLSEIIGKFAILINTKVDKVTCSQVDKSKLTDEEKKIFENEKFKYNDDGYAMIGDRYVISCDKSFGNIGDAITFYKKDGTKVECVIGHITSDENVMNTVNFYVDPEKWKASNTNNITIDLAKDISKIVNSGKYELKAEVGTNTKIDNATGVKTEIGTGVPTSNIIIGGEVGSSLDNNTSAVAVANNNVGVEASMIDTNAGTADVANNIVGVSEDSLNLAGVGTEVAIGINPLGDIIKKYRDNNIDTESSVTDTIDVSTDTTIDVPSDIAVDVDSNETNSVPVPVETSDEIELEPTDKYPIPIKPAPESDSNTSETTVLPAKPTTAIVPDVLPPEPITSIVHDVIPADPTTIPMEPDVMPPVPATIPMEPDVMPPVPATIPMEPDVVSDYYVVDDATDNIGMDNSEIV